MSATDTRAVVQQLVGLVERYLPYIGKQEAKAGRALLAALPEQPAASSHPILDGYVESMLVSSPELGHRLWIDYATREQADAAQEWLAAPAAPQGDSGAGAGLPLDTVRTGGKGHCWCRTCRPITLDDMRMVVCPGCGNKRCPKANFHGHACTGSNEPGQPGSAYPASTSLGAVSVPAETAPGARPQDEHAHPVIGVVLPSQSVRIGGEGERNQCDGCARGLPVNGFGNHRGPGDGDVQACTANRYGGSAEQPAPTFDAWWQSEVTANGGVPIGADYRHWAEKGYRAASQPSEEGRKA